MEPVLKCAFPAWLRRIDPFLAKEDENLLFQFFRERRARAGWRLRVPVELLLFLFAIVALPTWLFITVSVLPVGAVGYGMAIGATLGGAGCLVLIVYRRLTVRVEVGGTCFPATLHEAFREGQVVAPFCEDLWLGAVDARDLAEAIYLEGVDHVRRAARFAVLGPPVVAVAVYLNSTLPIHHWPLLVSCLLATLAVSAYLGAACLFGFVNARLEEVRFTWEKYARCATPLRNLAAKAVEIIVGIMPNFVVWFLLFSTLFPFLDKQHDSLEGWVAHANQVSLCMLLFTVVMVFFVWVIIRSHPRERDEHLEKLGALFEPVFRRGVVADPDADRIP